MKMSKVLHLKQIRFFNGVQPFKETPVARRNISILIIDREQQLCSSFLLPTACLTLKRHAGETVRWPHDWPAAPGSPLLGKHLVTPANNRQVGQVKAED